MTLSSCFFHISPLSNVIPKYLTSLDSWILWLKRIGSLCHVNEESISDVLNDELNIDSDDQMDLEIEVETVSE
jgi:hypothetical protein